MTMTSYDISFSMLFLPPKQTLSVVIELNTPFCNIHSPYIFHLQINQVFCKSKVNSPTIKFNNLLAISFFLKHPKHFTIKSCFKSKWTISRVVTSVKPFLTVGVDIFVKSLVLIYYARELESVKSNVCLIPVLGLNIVVMKVIHQGFT